MKDLRDLQDLKDTPCKSYKRRINYRTTNRHPSPFRVGGLGVGVQGQGWIVTLTWETGTSCAGGRRGTLDPTPDTLHSTPYTLHLTPYTLHRTPYTQHPTPYTHHPSHCGGASREERRGSGELWVNCWRLSDLNRGLNASS